MVVKVSCINPVNRLGLNHLITTGSQHAILLNSQCGKMNALLFTSFNV